MAYPHVHKSEPCLDGRGGYIWTHMPSGRQAWSTFPYQPRRIARLCPVQPVKWDQSLYTYVPNPLFERNKEKRQKPLTPERIAEKILASIRTSNIARLGTDCRGLRKHFTLLPEQLPFLKKHGLIKE